MKTGMFLVLFSLTGVVEAKSRAQLDLDTLILELNAAITQTHETNRPVEVKALISKGVDVVLLAPAYWPAKGFGIDEAALAEIQEFVDEGETGHLFFISGKKVVAQATLSQAVEPVVGQSRNRKVFFQITHDPRASRPVRIQIVEH